MWFQNARAKWRRNAMRQESSSGQGLNPLGSLSIPNVGGGGGGPPSVQSNTSGTMEAGMTPSHALEEIHHMTFAELY